MRFYNKFNGYEGFIRDELGVKCFMGGYRNNDVFESLLYVVLLGK